MFFRKSEDSGSNRKRLCNPRYVGDLCRDDFTSDEAWFVLQNHLTENKSKMKTYSQKIRRLNKKIGNLQEIMDHLKEKGLLSNDAMDTI